MKKITHREALKKVSDYLRKLKIHICRMKSYDQFDKNIEMELFSAGERNEKLLNLIENRSIKDIKKKDLQLYQ